MAQPPAYNRQADFSEYQAAHPAAPFNGADADAEFDALETTIDAILTNLALLQNDSGGLVNGIVTPNSLSTATKALIAADWTPLGNWATLTVYAVGDLVQNESAGVTTSYVCAVAHTAGTLATDVAAGKWVTLGATIAGSAASITFSPTGTIAATDVQAAIAEAASDALQITQNLADVGSVATARSNLSVPSKAELQNQTVFVAAAGGGADAITASYTPAPTALVDKMRFVVVAAAANTSTTPTFTPNSGTISAKTIVKGANSPLVAGDIAGQYAVCIFQYNSTLDKWVLLNPAVAGGAVAKIGDTMTGALIMSGAAINTAQGSDVASDTTINLDTATGNVVDVTGTTAITGITLSQGRVRIIRFTGALTFTHSSTLVLPGAANITTAAGDFAIVAGYAAGAVRCVLYSKATGRATIETAAATQAEMESNSSTTAYVTPGRIRYAPGVAKWFCYWDLNASVTSSLNVSSLTDGGTGTFTANLSTAFSGTGHCTFCSCLGAGTAFIVNWSNQSASAIGFAVYANVATGTRSDGESYYNAGGFGDFA